ncbi:MAG TPA: glycosyltransferase 87 family protein [Gaiellaceae bacterium]
MRRPLAVVESGLLRTRRAAGAVLGLVVVSCVVIPGGLLSRSFGGDVYYYRTIGHRILEGQIPYHDFYLEYPPGAIPVFAVPSLISQAHYFLVFKLLMTGCAVVAAVAGIVVLDRAGAAQSTRARAVVVLGLAPVALGPLFLNRYDLWPAALVALALVALAVDRPRLAFALLAVATVAKIYPVAVALVAAVHVFRTRGRTEVARALAVFAAAALLFVIPFAAVGFGGLGYSFYIQATRHLQVESLGAQLLVAAGHLGLYHPTAVNGAPGSRDLAGHVADAVGFLSSALEVLAVLVVARLYGKGRIDTQRLVLAVAAAVAAFVAFGKVLSPQYVVWLIPLVPLVGLGVGSAASLLLVLALVSTQIEFYYSDRVAGLGAISWLVLARNVFLVGLFALLTRRLARGSAA